MKIYELAFFSGQLHISVLLLRVIICLNMCVSLWPISWTAVMWSVWIWNLQHFRNTS